jgi:hypothetical protein
MLELRALWRSRRDERGGQCDSVTRELVEREKNALTRWASPQGSEIGRIVWLGSAPRAGERRTRD